MRWLLLQNVAAHLVTLHPLDHRAAVVALVGDQLFDAAVVHLGPSVGPLLRFPSNLLRHHRSRVQIDPVLGLVRQVRATFFHLRNPRISIRRALPFPIRYSLLAHPIRPRQLLAA
jgi:hypothetical protein